MFGRNKTESPAAATSTEREAAPPAAGGAHTPGKGRPTPSRKEAQAEAKRRARAAVDTKAARRLQRDKRAELARKQRQGMKEGDERYLMARDKGPVKRFTRDFIDARLSIAELLLPILVLALVLQSVGNPSMVNLGSSLMTTTILVVFADSAFAIWRLKRTLRAEMPDESLKGVTFYALMRMLQLRPTRIPKTRVKIGGRPK